MISNNHGQAIIEFLLVFVFLTSLAIGIAKGLGNFSHGVFKSFSYVLTQELTIGMCPKDGRGCWHDDAYVNRVP